MPNNQKSFYTAKSSGLITIIGHTEYRVVKDQVYEWGEEEAQIYLSNAPDNFIKHKSDPRLKADKADKSASKTTKKDDAKKKEVE